MQRVELLGTGLDRDLTLGPVGVEETSQLPCGVEIATRNARSRRPRSNYIVSKKHDSYDTTSGMTQSATTVRTTDA